MIEQPQQLHFFRSYYLAGKSVGERRGEFYSMLLDYMFAGVEPDPSSDFYGLFLLAAPTISKSRANTINGAKRRAKAEANPEANTEANPEANTGAKADRNRNRNRKKEEGECALTLSLGVSLETIREWVETHFPSPHPPDSFLAEFHRRMTESGWQDSRGRSLEGGRWQRELSAWWANEQKKNSAARVDGQVPTDANGIRPTTGEEVWRDD